MPNVFVEKNSFNLPRVPSIKKYGKEGCVSSGLNRVCTTFAKFLLESIETKKNLGVSPSCQWLIAQL